MKRLLVALLLFAGIIGPTTAAERERSAAISRDILAQHINYLASDELGGRGANSEGIEQAAEYIAWQYMSYGLLPGGDDGSYFQPFAISAQARITDRCRLEVAGAQIECTPREDFVPFPFSSSGPFEGSVAFVGYGITNQDKNYDDYDGIDVRGKVVLALRYEPQEWTKDNDGRRTDHATFPTKANLARQHGAAALLIVNPPTVEPDDLYRFRSGRGSTVGLPMIHVTRTLADDILAAGGLPSSETLFHRINRKHKPASAALAGVTLKGDSGLKLSKIKNVIGILPGAGPLAHEYVVFGGHYDHLGNVPPRRMPNMGDFDPSEARIHNGADDNASGTAGVMELARIYTSGPKPRRSLVFMGFAGEEIGLLGSAHFAKNPTVPLENIVAMINLDMIGRLEGRPVEIWGTGSAQEFGALVDKHARSIPGLEVNNITEMRRDSDHASFYGKDIPVIFAFSGMHPDYHRPSDDYDKIDYDGTVGILRFIETVADDIIQADARPTFQKAPMRSRSGRFGVKVRMGFMPEPLGTSDKPGVGVLEVSDDQPAQKAGMQAGDRIIAIDGKPVKDIMDYMKVLRPFSPGDEVEITVRRNDRDLTLKLTLAGR